MSALLAEPRPAHISGATTRLSDAIAAVDRAVRLFQTDGSRVARWRIVTQLIEARNALADHARLCAAESGPLRHVTTQRPRLAPDVQCTLDEHEPILRQVDGLVASLTVSPADDGNGVAPLSATLKISGALLAHRRRCTGIVYEWANRDIGGES
jgi:hypothetical protein